MWRKVCWSEDATLLALAYSDGAVEVCDTIGRFMNIKLNYGRMLLGKRESTGQLGIYSGPFSHPGDFTSLGSRPHCVPPLRVAACHGFL